MSFRQSGNIQVEAFHHGNKHSSEICGAFARMKGESYAREKIQDQVANATAMHDDATKNLDYWNGHQRGLRDPTGESFGTDGEHDMMGLAEMQDYISIRSSGAGLSGWIRIEVMIGVTACGTRGLGVKRMLVDQIDFVAST